MGGPPRPYFCIHCGHCAPQIYKTYANGNLVKLLNCKGCGELLDKYVEYDAIIVALNLILLNPAAYRHVLLNHSFEGFWKLGIVSLFTEAYCYWCFQKGVDSLTNTTDFYELEINFYKVLVRTAVSTAVFQFVVFVSTSGKKGMSGTQFSYKTLWKGLFLAGFTEIFKLIALIWSYANDYNRIFLVDVLFVLSNIQCYYVSTGRPQWVAASVILSAFLLQRYALQFYDKFVTL